MLNYERVSSRYSASPRTLILRKVRLREDLDMVMVNLAIYFNKITNLKPTFEKTYFFLAALFEKIS